MRASGRGRLHSFTAVHQPANPSFRESAPYIYAMIELNEGPRMVSNLVDCAYEDARVDMPVEAVPTTTSRRR
ncbi:MAG: OB-fold domain-containing protein [Dehalococcoidia bacterium]